jgi:hypothetical protein
MHALAEILGAFIIFSVLWEIFETIILPRRVQRKVRVTRFFYLGTWRPWRMLAGRTKNVRLREELLGLYGPASLLILFFLWAVGLIAAYGLLYWGLGSQLAATARLPNTIWTDIYFSASNFLTLGLGDLLPRSGLVRTITMLEAGNGFGFVGLVIAYLPTLYASFSSREVNISLLDARAGSPATSGEMLRRHAHFGELKDLDRLLGDWEDWSAALMESHISYPVLCYFRSQHSNQSWVAALTAILDTCALVMIGVNDMPDWQARLTFAICRHALVDITQVFHRVPLMNKQERLPLPAFEKLRDELRKEGLNVGSRADSYARLKTLREMYEPYAFSLSEWLLMPLPAWSRTEGSKDNWTAGFWESDEM